MATVIVPPLPAVNNLTLGAANVCTKVTVPTGARLVTIKPRANPAKFAVDTTLTDGGALGAVAYVELAADQGYEITMHGLAKTRADTGQFFLACAAGSVVCEILTEGG